MFLDNSWYSHRKILADFCNIKDRPAFASIQHGWFKILDEEIKTLKLSKIPGSSFLCWSKTIEKQFKKNNLNNVISIGAPFIYLYDDLKNEFSVERNILLFPPHSGELEGRPSNFEKHKDLIDYVKNKYNGPYSVCLFYQDMKEDIIKIYKNENCKIFCCGQREDANFLKNFINIVSLHQNILVCEMTTAYLYSIYMKKKIEVIHDFNDSFTHRTFHSNIIDEDLWRFYEKMFPYFKNEIDDKIKLKHVKFELGCENKKTKEEILNLMGWDSSLKKIISSLIHKIR